MSGGKRPRRLDETAIIAAFERTGGNISASARSLGISRQELYATYLQQSETLQAALREQREVMIDMAEAALVRSVSRDHWPAIVYILNTVGRRRGWGENQRVEHSGSLEIREYRDADAR